LFQNYRHQFLTNFIGTIGTEMGSDQEILLGRIAQATEAFKDLGEE